MGSLATVKWESKWIPLWKGSFWIILEGIIVTINSNQTIETTCDSPLVDKSSRKDFFQHGSVPPTPKKDGICWSWWPLKQSFTKAHCLNLTSCCCRENLHHLGCIKPCTRRSKLPINWCIKGKFLKTWHIIQNPSPRQDQLSGFSEHPCRANRASCAPIVAHVQRPPLHWYEKNLLYTMDGNTLLMICHCIVGELRSLKWCISLVYNWGARECQHSGNPLSKALYKRTERQHTRTYTKHDTIFHGEHHSNSSQSDYFFVTECEGLQI